MQILVIGGTQFIGKHLVAALVKAGHTVTVLHRRPEHDLGKKVANLQADRNDPAQLKRALAGKSFDAAFDLVYDWEKGTPASAVEASARLLTGKVERYVFMSSVAAYGDGLNHHEGDALAADDHGDRYARQKATSERALFRLHQRHGTPVVTLRPPFVYGPGNPYYREQFFWDRLRDKRPIILPGDGRRLMQFVYVKDVVWACQRALECPNAVGHAFNIANARPLTQAEVLDALSAASGKQAEIVRVPRERIARAGGHPLGPNLYFGIYFDLPPITTVISKAQRVLGLKPASFADGLKETYKWYLRNSAKKTLDYSFEDRLLARERAQLAS
jgi:nucleoside-diphosphate-sugar epimerase